MRKILLLFFTACLLYFDASAQNRVITGKVTDQADGSPIPGVNVIVKGTTSGTVTESDGTYSISISGSGDALMFSFIGFASKEIPVGQFSVIDVQLESDAKQLSEVIVVAGGLTVQRRELGTQATTVKGTDLTSGKASNFAAGLQGRVPGLLVSAVSSGVNPNIRLTLRGNRSITGNNQALIVLDNVITPLSILGNLNPEDIEDVQVLNGAGAAALYGSDASNGALIITTKKGKAGRTEVKFANTVTFENVSFLPKLQSRFGSGTTPDDVPTYTPYENQQYGPRFDGTIRPIGKPLENGSIQMVPYSPKDSRTSFWETGVQNQSDFSIATGKDNSTMFLAGQLFSQESTIPYDRYNRVSLRLNGTQRVGDQLKVTYSTSFISAKLDVSSQQQFAYDDLLQSPAQVDVTKYKKWKTDPFANPNGYFNEYYANPYFTLANNRSVTRNDYLQGNIELKWNPVTPLSFTYRIGMATENEVNKIHTGKFTYSDYTKSISGTSKRDIPGFVSDGSQQRTQIINDLFGEYRASISENFNLTVVAGATLRSNTSNRIGAGATGLVVDGLFNISNSPNIPTAIQNNTTERQIGLYGDLRLGYKDFLFFHATGRNDWRSVLSKENRSFFYPSFDISFIASEVLPFIKDNAWIDNLKVRGGYSQVGQVTIGPFALNATYSQGSGYPYSSGPGFTLSDVLVSPDIRPEITTGLEAGFDLDLSKFLASVGLTVYQTNTVDQTITVLTSGATGYGVLRTNVGEVQNQGFELYAKATPIETTYGLSVTVGANYSKFRNEVISLSDQSDNLVLSTFGGSRILAKKGSPFPYLQVTDYDRDPEGRIVVDRITGLPRSDGSFHDLGITTPTDVLGINAEISYKGFRLAATAEYRTGHYIYNGVTTSFDFSGAGIRNTWFNRERFVIPNSSYEDPDNEGSYIPNNSITTNTGGANFWTSGAYNTGIGRNFTNSAAFWKIREISLRYDFPKSLLSNMKVVRAASISVQGRNLFIWTPKTNLYTDPEFSTNGAQSNAIGFTSIGLTPPARYVGATVSLTF